MADNRSAAAAATPAAATTAAPRSARTTAAAATDAADRSQAAREASDGSEGEGASGKEDPRDGIDQNPVTEREEGLVMKKHIRCAILAAAAALMLAAPFAAHSQILAGLSLERLGVLSTMGTGARPFAMGGAYTAAGNDVFSLLYNPAGLAEMRRGEVSIGFHQRSDEITNTYLDLSATQSSSHTSLGHIAAAYPLPTYRGSLVLAFGV